MVLDVDEFYQAAILFNCEDENKRLFDVDSVESLEVVPEWFIVMRIILDLPDLLHQGIIKRPILLANFFNLGVELLAHGKLIWNHLFIFPRWTVLVLRNLRTR